MANNINCPKCGHSFALGEAQIEEYKKELRQQMETYKQQKQEELRRKEEDFEKQKTDILKLVENNNNICVAGDFNISFSGYTYPSKAIRKEADEFFQNADLGILTRNNPDSPDHIAISKAFLLDISIEFSKISFETKVTDHSLVTAMLVPLIQPHYSQQRVWQNAGFRIYTHRYIATQLQSQH